MIEQLLPDAVVGVDTTADAKEIVLFAEEQQALGRAVEKRRREFTTGRACARAALAKLGLGAQAIPSGQHGEPCWPSGVVGSITHCAGYRACALARSADMLTIGIDAEPHAPLPSGLLEDIARPEEMPVLDRLCRQRPDVHWDRLLFSAKESVYKAWFPLGRRWLGFEDAVVTLDPLARTFTARLLVQAPPPDGRRLQGFSGRWAVRDGLVLTAIALETPA